MGVYKASVGDILIKENRVFVYQTPSVFRPVVKWQLQLLFLMYTLNMPDSGEKPNPHQNEIADRLIEEALSGASADTRKFAQEGHTGYVATTPPPDKSVVQPSQPKVSRFRMGTRDLVALAGGVMGSIAVNPLLRRLFPHQPEAKSLDPTATPFPEKPVVVPTATLISTERVPFGSTLESIEDIRGPKFNIGLQKARELVQSSSSIQKDSSIYDFLNEQLPRAKIDKIDIALMPHITNKPGEMYKGIDVSRVPIVRTQTVEIDDQGGRVTLDFRVFRTANTFQVYASVYPDSDQPDGMQLSPLYFKPGAYKPEEVARVNRALSANIVRLVAEQARGIGTYKESYLESIGEQASGTGEERPFLEITSNKLQVKTVKP